MSIFYDHLVSLDELHQELLDFNLGFREHYSLLQLVDSALNHEIVAVCLDCLPNEHHEAFLIRLKNQPNDPDLLVLLKEKDPEIEGKIKTKAAEVKEKIKNDLRKHKKT